MPFNLNDAAVYDIETYPNVFTLSAELLHHPVKSVWQISKFRDDRYQLLKWFDHLHKHQIGMLGFFSLNFDYIVCHFLYTHPNCTVEELYEKAQEVILSINKFGHMVWQDQRFAPQIDLFKINHFDNKAKTTSLKALEINRRSENVIDLPFPPGTYLTEEQINGTLIPYNQHDTSETKGFAHDCMTALEFRIGLMDQIQGDVMNFNDTKIGAKLLEQRIGEEICYNYDGVRKTPRQTIRNRIALKDIIFPYIQFQNPEFNRVLSWMKEQVLTSDDFDDPEATVKTKGVFKGVTANVGGLTFYFGTGGIHASVTPQRFVATGKRRIRDIDVASLYPSIAIVNNLAPAHLGDAYRREYRKLPAERKEWQKKKGKKCVEANSMKLAGNGVYGNSNNKFSIFFDTQYTVTITINGQLMLCMLAEWLLNVPTLQIIQANTDGITYWIEDEFEPQAAKICKAWEDYTKLVLEDVDYKRMWIRDVNNYVAEDMKGDLKQKGAYWHPDPNNYVKSISEAQPPAWHKDLGNTVSIQAAVAQMVRGIPIEHFIRLHTNPFDFMLRIKANGQAKLLLDGQQVQKTSRYYVARNGGTLIKQMPPEGPLGQFKRAQKIDERYYEQIMRETNGAWDARVCTKNKSKYEMRNNEVQSGWKVAMCNTASNFDFNNLNYDYYINEAHKLII